MSNRTKADIRKLIQYSESVDAKVSEDSREALRSLIDQGEAIGHLVQYYSKTQSSIVLDLLCRIREPNDTEFCNRIQEYMEGNPLATIVLLGQIVQKAPSWLSKLVDHSLFHSVLKLMNSSNNTVLVVAGVLFISSLLPYCSAPKKSLLNEIFTILLSSCTLLYKRKKVIEKAKNADRMESVYVSHLYCAITQYFILLYGIYPTNLLTFLREQYSKGRERRAFSVLEPILSCVKFHPQLLKMNADQEMDRNRWSQREAHDFVADCRHVLVRPVVAPTNNHSIRGGGGHLSPSRSARSSSVTRMHQHHKRSDGSVMSSTHSLSSSSITKSSDSNWDDMWSPSINLGIETPPDTRCATPLAHRPNTISNSTILPGSVSSRRSTAASDEMRRPARHSSFGQKFTEIFRGRTRALEKKENYGDESEFHSTLSIDKILAATKEEAEDSDNIEVIDARAEIRRRDSEMSQVEEGVDATEICLSPSSTLSYRTTTERASPTITPTTMVEVADNVARQETSSGAAVHYHHHHHHHHHNRSLGAQVHKWRTGADADESTTNEMNEQTTANTTLETDMNKTLAKNTDENVAATIIHHSHSASSLPRAANQKREQQQSTREHYTQQPTNNNNNDGSLEEAIEDNTVDESLTVSTLDAPATNRFSVSSFFRAVNRQRFTSECPPSVDFINRITTPSSRSKRRYKSTPLPRISSCPDLIDSERLRESMRKLETQIVITKKTPRKRRSLTAAEISDAIEREFPYLNFIKTLTLANIDEESIDVELSEEHERRRRAYIEASFEHHSCLKQLGLADRLPAKIYDDMTNFIHGLSLEKQRDILITRLSLVNQHLLYERCGRLLHAERNRRLFGRIKQQKLSDAEKIYLQKSLHTAQLEREQLVSALTGLRKQSMQERKKRDEIENRYREDLLRSRQESDKYIKELDELGHRVIKLTEVNEQLQFDLDTFKRRCENAEAQLSLAETKIAELELMKPELQKAHRANQQLKDKIAQCEAYAKGINTARAVELSTLSERSDQQLLAQMTQLKIDLKKERNLKDAARAKTIEMEEEWKEERQRVNDLKMKLERAATLHIQQSEAAEHKFLSLLSVCQKQQAHILDLNTYVEKLIYNRDSSANVATPMPIPKSSVPDEILSYDSSVCGSDSTPFFPPELFAKQISHSSETNGAGTAGGGGIGTAASGTGIGTREASTGTIIWPPERNIDKYRIQSGTL